MNCAAAAEPEAAFARVDDAVISAAQYEAALQNTLRQKHFHREVPEAKRQEFAREVAQALIERSLVVAEARRRGLTADRVRIDRAMAEYDQRYAESAAWQQQREGLLREIEERDLAAQLRRAVQDVGRPTDEEARAYFAAHPDRFVEPAQWRVAASVRKVEPSSPKEAWDAAEREAGQARERMLQSGDFSELADRGTFHDGVLPPAIAERLATLATGELSEPIRLLEGVALVRLTERKVARPQSFDEARARAGQLLQREEAEQRWNKLVASLRSAATIRIDLARYPALAGLAP